MANIEDIPDYMNPLISAYSYDLPRQQGSAWAYIHSTLRSKIQQAGMNIQDKDIGRIEGKLRSIFENRSYYTPPIKTEPATTTAASTTPAASKTETAAKPEIALEIEKSLEYITAETGIPKTGLYILGILILYLMLRR